MVFGVLAELAISGEYLVEKQRIGHQMKILRNWKKAFIAALEECGSVRESAKAAGISHVTAYQNKREDPAFREQWEQAIEMGADTLEDEARRRAMMGVSKGSDTLLMFLLKG